MTTGAANSVNAGAGDPGSSDAAKAVVPRPTESEDPGPLLRIVKRQEIAFAAVGVVNTALGMGLTVMWLAILGASVPPAVAVVLAYAISIVIAFVLHRTLVFRVRGHMIRDFLRFVGVNSGGLLMNMVLLSLAVSVLHLPSKPSAVVVMGLVAIASYFGHRYISFRREPVPPPPGGSGAEQF
ncbi:GtrA family protein [Nocardia sp. CA-119907]|uniref:GtrA family protein n=1 Tax=Nocardia sp. CA-119907 TaxID=3239973 RepID=UPI003D9560D7